MRRILLVLLGFGVFAGYGSAIASARWHHRNAGGHGCESRWNREEARAVVAPAPAPQTIVVPQAAPAPAAAMPSQQIFLIMPGAQAAPSAAPQVITIPVPTAAPAPVASP